MTIDWRRVPGLLLAAVAAGCVNLGPGTLETPRFYMLSSLVERQPALERLPATNPRTLAVGPVTIPQHLNRPQMVTRLDPNRVQVSELDQWVEPLAENITRVLAENLSLLLGTDQVYTFPWDPASQVDIQVSVDIVRFDAGPGGTTQFEARWTLRTPNRDAPDTRRATRVKVPVEGEGEEVDAQELAAAQSTALEHLSRDIAAEIKVMAWE